MMTGIKKKIISVVLIAVLLMGVIPAAYAATPFKDVPEEAWYASYVDYVYQHNLMEGTSDTAFNPNKTMTRAMFVTVLYRVAGKPECTEKAPFNDVPDGTWYTDAVNWAYENQIVDGVSDTRFAPMSSVLREQMVAILYRYCDFSGQNTQGFFVDFGSFEDFEDISDYAKYAFCWAMYHGIIKGTSATTLSPKSGATRAQCAAILQRYMEWYESEHPVTEADIPALEAYARSYAQSVGFTIDTSLNLSNAGYYPAWAMKHNSLDAAKTYAREGVDFLVNDFRDEGGVEGCRYNCIVEIDGSGKVTIYHLYG